MGHDRLADAEAAYLAARSARDRLDVARAMGEPARTDALETDSAAAFARCRAALAEVDADELVGEDRRALAAMRHGLDAAEANLLPGIEDGDPSRGAGASDDGPDPRRALDAIYAETAGALQVGDELLARPQVLARLGAEPDAARRRRLFLALEPLWRAVDGEGDERSPYRGILASAADGFGAARSPIHANATALGVKPDAIEDWAMTALEAWRAAFVHAGDTVEPWDWWWRAGEAQRALQAAMGLGSLLDVNRRVHAALGADLEALGIVFDIHARASRPSVPVAYTTFGERPHRRPDGTWHVGRPVILETLTDGGLGELAELVHETGHAIHIAGIRTRPAFADWPDSDALTEALAELVTADVFDPRWQRRWVPGSPPLPTGAARRARHAETALDAAWAVFELRLLRDPERRPNDVWTEITRTWLGIAPHPEWSWWAMRGQLVEEPGYMANYAVGAVLAADLRAAIRAARSDWIDGDSGWYAWVSEHIYRFGLERGAGDVVRAVLGRPPTAEALRVEMDGSTTS